MCRQLQSEIIALQIKLKPSGVKEHFSPLPCHLRIKWKIPLVKKTKTDPVLSCGKVNLKVKDFIAVHENLGEIVHDDMSITRIVHPRVNQKLAVGS